MDNQRLIKFAGELQQQEEINIVKEYNIHILGC